MRECPDVYCCFLCSGDCRLDITTSRKTPTLGLHRIAKLLGNDGKLGKSAGNLVTPQEEKIFQNSISELKESKEEEKLTSLRPESETRSVSGWSRLSSARAIVGSESSPAARCNGKLQRTKRIEPEPEPADDKESIASVTIISVPSGIVTPVTAEGESSGLMRTEVTSEAEVGPSSLVKQSSLPSSGLLHKHLGRRAQSPSSGWL